MGKATYTVTVTNNSNGVSVDYVIRLEINDRE